MGVAWVSLGGMDLWETLVASLGIPHTLWDSPRVSLGGMDFPLVASYW